MDFFTQFQFLLDGIRGTLRAIMMLPITVMYGLMMLYVSISQNCEINAMPVEERFVIEIQRNYQDDAEAALIDIAENFTPDPYDCAVNGLCDECRPAKQDLDEYTGLLQGWREDPDQVPGVTASLHYTAGITYYATYTSDQIFTDVYIVSMDLDYGEICGPLCGYGYGFTRIAILNAAGEVLQLTWDPDYIHCWIS